MYGHVFRNAIAKKWREELQNEETGEYMQLGK